VRLLIFIVAPRLIDLSWHHVLKGKFLQHKRNRRMDHLISILIEHVVPYYLLKQCRQDLGFEGINLEVKKCQDIAKKAAAYTADDVEVH
jgi:hypothetical protein